ncbi:bifunctional transcriptional activator/DNA repair enzyme AdaA [Cohnella sp. GCM10027633]|uniref:bifunctional transcriptional activator/DNA repair enzyme AdaA n=1 Tax=unclassified Cohnella TaxID=2636738 RepID=UPI003628ED3F
MDDTNWQAIVECDESYDGKFYYAVATTGIFCRPSCKSRTPSRDNVTPFDSTAQALAAGYRPCKRCKPDELAAPNESWVERISAYIEQRLAEPITLEALSAHMHGSPYHLQRTFKQLRGMTPAQYALGKRIEHAKAMLAGTGQSVSDIAAAVGMRSAGHFATVFQSKTGLSPTAYRRHRLATTNLREGGYDERNADEG